MGRDGGDEQDQGNCGGQPDAGGTAQEGKHSGQAPVAARIARTAPPQPVAQTENKVGKQELDRAKEYYIGQLNLSLEDTAEHMLWLGENFLSLGKFVYPQEAIRQIKRVNAGHLQDLAKKILNRNLLNLALIGPLKDKHRMKINKGLHLL